MKTNALAPLHQARLQHLKRRICSILIPSWTLTLFLAWGYFSGYKRVFAFEMVPLIAALALFITWDAWVSWQAELNSRVIVYFPKSSPEVEQTTFLSGAALAHNWQKVEDLAMELGLEPLSMFGLEDENEVETLEWHSARRALVTIEKLLSCGQLAPAVADDLQKIEASLREADAKNVPFRLLLRADSGINWAELKARKGYF